MSVKKAFTCQQHRLFSEQIRDISATESSAKSFNSPAILFKRWALLPTLQIPAHFVLHIQMVVNGRILYMATSATQFTKAWKPAAISDAVFGLKINNQSYQEKPPLHHAVSRLLLHSPCPSFRSVISKGVLLCLNGSKLEHIRSTGGVPVPPLSFVCRKAAVEATQ